MKKTKGAPNSTTDTPVSHKTSITGNADKWVGEDVAKTWMDSIGSIFSFISMPHQLKNIRKWDVRKGGRFKSRPRVAKVDVLFDFIRYFFVNPRFHFEKYPKFCNSGTVFVPHTLSPVFEYFPKRDFTSLSSDFEWNSKKEISKY